MKIRSLTILFITVLSLTFCLTDGVHAFTIGYFDSNRARGTFDDTGSLSNETFGAALMSKGYTLVGTDVLTSTFLSGVDVFFTSPSSSSLSAAEATAIANFWNSGGSIFIETDSNDSEMAAANSFLAALGVGTSFGGALLPDNDANGGTIVGDDNPITNGPNGDVRNLTYAVSTAYALNMGADGEIGIAMIDPYYTMAVYEPNAFTSGTGKLFMAVDPFTFDLFTNSTGALYNPNNLVLGLNVIDQVASTIPEPSTFLLLGAGLAGVGLLRRRFKKQI
jgi:hypothetical protein